MIRRKVRVDLSRYDSDWKDSFILLNPLSGQEVIEIQELNNTSKDSKGLILDNYGILKNRFVSGMIYDSETKVLRELVKEDIDSFDLEIMADLLGAVVGDVSKKA